jgi:methylmalonyl-CoA/ethylmalonyl-CoA epimerase
LAQVAVPVQNLDRATAFYRDVLGLPFLFSAPPGLAFFQAGDVRLMLSVGDGEGGGAAPVLYYAVDDLDAAWAALAAAECDMVRPPERVAELPGHTLWMCFARDSEGTLFGLMREVPHAR